MSVSSNGSVGMAESLQKLHIVFPLWMFQRSDFLEHFQEVDQKFAQLDGLHTKEYILENSLKISGEDRKMSDIDVICNWLKARKILTEVKHNRLIELCRKMRYYEFPAGTTVVTKGDSCDAFYVIIRGSLSVVIEGDVVGTIEAGQSFGERALESGKRRAATVVTASPCSLFMLLSSEFQSACSMDQMKENESTINFLQSRSPAFSSFSYPRLLSMIHNFNRRKISDGEFVFRQHDSTRSLFIILSGTVIIKRSICPREIVNRYTVRGRQVSKCQIPGFESVSSNAGANSSGGYKMSASSSSAAVPLPTIPNGLNESRESMGVSPMRSNSTILNLPPEQLLAASPRGNPPGDVNDDQDKGALHKSTIPSILAASMIPIPNPRMTNNYVVSGGGTTGRISTSNYMKKRSTGLLPTRGGLLCSPADEAGTSPALSPVDGSTSSPSHSPMSSPVMALQYTSQPHTPGLDFHHNSPQTESRPVVPLFRPSPNPINSPVAIPASPLYESGSDGNIHNDYGQDNGGTKLVPRAENHNKNKTNTVMTSKAVPIRPWPSTSGRTNLKNTSVVLPSRTRISPITSLPSQEGDAFGAPSPNVPAVVNGNGTAPHTVSHPWQGVAADPSDPFHRHSRKLSFVAPEALTAKSASKSSKGNIHRAVSLLSRDHGGMDKKVVDVFSSPPGSLKPSVASGRGSSGRGSFPAVSGAGKPIKVTVCVKRLHVGDVFGEDCILNAQPNGTTYGSSTSAAEEDGLDENTNKNTIPGVHERRKTYLGSVAEACHEDHDIEDPESQPGLDHEQDQRRKPFQTNKHRHRNSAEEDGKSGSGEEVMEAAEAKASAPLFHTYTALAVGPVVVLELSQASAQEHFKSNKRSELMRSTADLHRKDVELVIQHEEDIKNQLNCQRQRAIRNTERNTVSSQNRRVS